MRAIATNGHSTMWVTDDVDVNDPTAVGTMKDKEGRVLAEGVLLQSAFARGYWEDLEEIEERKTKAAQQPASPRVSIETAAEVMTQVLAGEWTFEEGLNVLRSAAEEGL